ncbi:MAG TPA: YceI family protein [Blastocatellia bacterium]|nr:YceI family protein [Blastocatellia bacterium]
MKKTILAITRRAAPVACFIILSLAQGQDLSAQRANREDKTRVYTIDLSQSQVIATLTQEGFISRRYPNHRVEVENFSGRIEIPERDETRLAVEVEAEAKSLTNADEGMTDFERKEFHNVLNNEVLESGKFPTIKFVSVSVSDASKSGGTRKFTLNGDLTLRDATKQVSFPVTVTISKDQLRATGEAELKQTDFGITPYSGKLGLIKIGDVIKIKFEIVAKSP